MGLVRREVWVGFKLEKRWVYREAELVGSWGEELAGRRVLGRRR